MKYRLLGACVAAACCAAPAFAQGLSRVEILGLQQQLRDDGCGVTHVSGRMDAMTRAAVKKCESKYSGATDARSMLAAMHIGFGNGNSEPTMSQARSGGSMDAGMHAGMHAGMSAGTSGSMSAGANARTSARMRRRMDAHRDSAMGGMQRNMKEGMKGERKEDMKDQRKEAMKDGMRGMHDSTRLRHGRMRDTTMHHDTNMTRGSGGMVDTHKATPMTTPVPSTNPTAPSKPIP